MGAKGAMPPPPPNIFISLDIYFCQYESSSAESKIIYNLNYGKIVCFGKSGIISKYLVQKLLNTPLTMIPR